MRFLSVHAERFGPLSDWKAGQDAPLSGLVVVLGPNEAGKSSVRELLTAILYGFYPASRDTNPWAPWSGEDIAIRASLRTSSGEEVEVYRRLLAAPWGEVKRGDRVEELANRDLPEVRHLRSEVFLHSHSLTLGELAGLEDQGWEAVQERLVTGLGATDLRAPSEVAKELRNEASALWRPDQRGKPRYTELQSELQALRAARRDALTREREQREALATLEDLRRERDEVRGRRARLAARVDRLELLHPFRAKLSRLEELLEAMGDPESLKPIPPAPRERIETLETRLDAARERELETERRVARLRELIEELTEEDRKLLEHRREASALAAQVAALGERAERRGAIQRELQELDERLEEVASPLLDDPEGPLSPELFTDLPMAELRRAIPELDEARRRRIAALEALEAARERPLPPPPGSALPWVGALSLAVLLLAGGWLSGVHPLLFAGGLILLAALPLFVQKWWLPHATRGGARRLLDDEISRAEARAEGREREWEEARARVAAALSGVPLRPSLLEDPDLGLLTDLEQLRNLLVQRASRGRAREDVARADAKVERSLAELRQGALPGLPSDPSRALPELDRLLNAAIRREERADEARSQLDGGLEELERAAARRKEVEDELAALEADLSKAAGGDAVDPLTEVERRLDAQRRYQEAREEFEGEYPEAEVLRDRLAAVEADESPDWGDDAASITNARIEVEETHAEETHLGSEIAALEARIDRLEEEPTPGHIEGEIEAVSEELERLRREHDRSFLLARIVERAEHRFRTAHQPDLIRRAERYLRTITGGRYERLLLAEGDEGPIRLEAPHLPHTHPIAPPLSTGTREQAYLALRLAVATHLDEGHEPLPLFLDEVFVNWDVERRERGLELVRELSDERQVILFTCHPPLAAEVERRGGAVLTLPGPAA